MLPTFEPISLEKQDDYLKYLEACPQKASDYSFVNLWGWAEEYGLEWAFTENMVWIRQTRPDVLYWAPVGAWTDADWDTCPCVTTGGNRFIRVPEVLKDIWQNLCAGRLDITESRDHWDYLYDVKELTELRGNRFHKKKNLLRQFMKKYDYLYHSMTPDCVEAALDMQQEWFSWRDEESQQTLSAENRAISRVLTSWDALHGVFGGVIEVEGAQAAYTVAERLSEDTLVIHFEKGHTPFKGVYQAINQMFLGADASAYAYVNREQDLGDPGLRKAKESYNPVGYLKKYDVVVL